MIHIEFQNWVVFLPVGIILLALGVRLAYKVDWHAVAKGKKNQGPVLACVICCALAILLIASSIPYLFAAI